MEIEDHDNYKILASVARKCEVEKFRFDIKPLRNDVINHMGNLVPVTLIDEDTGATKDLLIKRAPSAPVLKEIVDEVYRREVYFYKILLPVFKKNIKNRLKLTIPECFYADSSPNNRVLVLQDMRTTGFKRYDKGFYLDREHLLISLENIAEFHSLSMIFNEMNIEPPNAKVLRSYTFREPTYYGKTQRFCLNKYLSLFKGMRCERILKDFHEDINSSGEYLEESVSKAKCLVYGHGDLWKENILFKYSDNKPVQICLVDYQITRLMSPAADVLFLIMNSTESSARRQYYKTFLSTYYNTLQRTLHENGLEPEPIYSQEDFEHDVKLVFPSCMILTFLAFLMWLNIEGAESLVSEIPDREVNNDNIAVFKQLMDDLVLDFVHLGLIDEKND